MTTQNVTNNFAGGKVIQMVYVNGASDTTGSLTPVDVSGATVNITPTSSSNNIIVMVGIPVTIANNNTMYIQVLRGVTVISATPYGSMTSTTGVSQHGDWYGGAYFCYLDSPASTSLLTYKLQFYAASSSPAVAITNATIVLMEVQP